jgi:hypothetical protein
LFRISAGLTEFLSEMQSVRTAIFNESGVLATVEISRMRSSTSSAIPPNLGLLNLGLEDDRVLLIEDLNVNGAWLRFSQ